MKAGLPPLLWAVLIVGAVLVISFSCVLGVERYRLHALKLCALTSLICVTLFAIEEIDGPFSGSLRISSAPFSVLIHRIELNPLTNGTAPAPSSAPSSR